MSFLGNLGSKIGEAAKQGGKNLLAGKGLMGNKQTALSAFRDWLKARQAQRAGQGGGPTPAGAPPNPGVTPGAGLKPPQVQMQAPQLSPAGMSPAPGPQAQIQNPQMGLGLQKPAPWGGFAGPQRSPLNQPQNTFSSGGYGG
jgi:hypothetical protein